MNSISASIRNEILINREIEVVWDCIFEFPKWSPAVGKAELISGEWREEGRVLLITKKESAGMDPFFLETIKLDPCKQLVNKVDSKDGGQANGFVDISLAKCGEKTKVIYSNYVTFRSEEKMPKGSFRGESAIESIKELYLKPLKEYAEKKPSSENSE